jgi:hypothetical protein
VSDEPIKYVSVTALTGLLPQPWMEPYANKHAALCAFTEQDNYRDLPTVEDRMKYVAGASKRYSRAAAERGTNIHAHVEKRNLGVVMDPWPLPVAASMRQYEDFLATVKPRIEAAECKVYHDDWRSAKGHSTSRTRRRKAGASSEARQAPRYLYAGTMDLLCEIDGRMSILDVKTGKSVHEDAALQINAYAHADFLIADPNHPDAVQITPARGRRWYEWRGKPEDEIPMPDIQAGYILHLRDDGWALHEVPISDELYEMFLSLFSVERWERELKKGVLKKVQTGKAGDDMREAA